MGAPKLEYRVSGISSGSFDDAVARLLQEGNRLAIESLKIWEGDVLANELTFYDDTTLADAVAYLDFDPSKMTTVAITVLVASLPGIKLTLTMTRRPSAALIDGRISLAAIDHARELGTQLREMGLELCGLCKALAIDVLTIAGADSAQPLLRSEVCAPTLLAIEASNSHPEKTMQDYDVTWFIEPELFSFGSPQAVNERALASFVRRVSDSRFLDRLARS